MAIYRLLQNSSFGPEEVAVMCEAYEQALLTLGVTNRSDPITEEIALKIIAMTRAGESNPAVLSAHVAEEVCSSSDDSAGSAAAFPHSFALTNVRGE